MSKANHVDGYENDSEFDDVPCNSFILVKLPHS